MGLHQAACNPDTDQEHRHEDQDEHEQKMMMRPGFLLIPMDFPRNFKVPRMVNHVVLHFQATFTSIALGLAFSDFGRWTFSTPSLYSALTLEPSASSGRVKLRMKLP